ncbi:MAG: hypothetical protein IJ761_05105 [Bacteroidales bacterium]|nr:hypothetical protein [Bacteroidales bacterium]
MKKTILLIGLFLVCLQVNAQSVANGDGQASADERANTALKWSLLPGAGQIYNHQAWKVPIIYGAFATMGYLIYDNYTGMKTFKEEYLYRVNHNDTPNLEDYAQYPTSSIYSLYNSYNRNFQLMIIITAGIYAVNLIDAYVFGHLFDFQIDDDISMSMHPSMAQTQVGFVPTLSFNFSF